MLAVSGVILLLVGTATLLQPYAFFATEGIKLGNDPGLLSEIRAPGGLLIGCAIAILLGTCRQMITQAPLMLNAIVYGSFGLSRLLSMVLDGLPSAPLMGATAVELVIGGVCVVSLLRLKPN
ncbi:DUF4345 domain-containing protein [Nodosilinea sp. LEGE 07088]|uniref:DUF4345 domain-containing protein n=1 Tax=Nodosilinea sp. LEGE 07088 TaxID=2777968 RepID=UPI00210542B0|nr:DUF4345 domain-containing protein [Nodosilinea sp. LEGE 07088]